MHIPIIGFAGWSGTGKTTVIEKLIPALEQRGIHTAVIKHDGHDFTIDVPGKDSWRYAQAGAVHTVITSAHRTARMVQHGSTLAECIAGITDADVILVEGFKNESIPKIGLYRKAAGKELPVPVQNCIALITDDYNVHTEKPCFRFEDTEALADFIIQEAIMAQQDFTHFNDQGKARMVDVSGKDITVRTATAAGRVLVNEQTFSLIRSGGMKKGDVLTVAQIAGIMGAKHTPDWIPMCHPISLSSVDLQLWLDEQQHSVEIEATVRCEGKTGVEMEALTAVSAAALTVYDMCKAVQRDMVIADIRLVRKSGGVHGDYERKETDHE